VATGAFCVFPRLWRRLPPAWFPVRVSPQPQRHPPCLHLLLLREPWFQCVHTWNNRAPELLPFCITPRLFFLTADRCVHLKICHHGQTAKMNAISLIYNNMITKRLCSKMKQLFGGGFLK
jgi:hypothetical protein